MKANISSEFRATIQGIVEWIEFNLSEPLTTRSLSEMSGYSLRYFQYCFKHITGMTPVIYIRYRRMRVAQQLLADMETSITEIAKYLGYRQQSTFCRAFKDYYSITPKEYQLNILSKSVE